jgi:hypothetical protein
MAALPIPGLGPRTEAPKLNPKANFAGAGLTPQEGFVLSRIDGRTSIAEICLITGLGEEATIAILQKLKAALLIITSASMSDLPPGIAPPSASRAATLGAGGRTASAAAPPSAHGTAAAAPSSAAAERGAEGGAPPKGKWPAAAPTTQSARPLAPLRDEEIDPALLAEGPELGEDVKRRVLAFHTRLPMLDFFDLLEIDPLADRQAIRRSYFRLSKEFHPDRYFGKDLGPYKERLSDVFKAISAAFAVLSDDVQREAYVLKLRDAAAAGGGRGPHR